MKTQVKGKQNGRTNSGSGKSTKFGKHIRAAKQRRNTTLDVESTVGPIADDIDAVNRITESDTFDSDNGLVGETSSVRGGSRDDSGRHGRHRTDGRDREQRGSDRNSDSNSADSPARKRRRRRTAEERARELAEQNSISLEQAKEIIETQKKPRRVKGFSDDILDGVEGSAILLGGIFEGGSHLLALALKTPDFDREYLKLGKEESQKLGEAVLKVIEAQSKYNRKRFDELMRKVYPYWNLAKVLVEITYPRYEIYKLELELKIEIAKQANNGVANNGKNPTTSTAQGFQTTDTGFDSGNGASSWPVQ